MTETEIREAELELRNSIDWDCKCDNCTQKRAIFALLDQERAVTAALREEATQARFEQHGYGGPEKYDYARKKVAAIEAAARTAQAAPGGEGT
jgi:hypothetical protein